MRSGASLRSGYYCAASSGWVCLGDEVMIGTGFRKGVWHSTVNSISGREKPGTKDGVSVGLVEHIGVGPWIQLPYHGRSAFGSFHILIRMDVQTKGKGTRGKGRGCHFASPLAGCRRIYRSAMRDISPSSDLYETSRRLIGGMLATAVDLPEIRV